MSSQAPLQLGYIATVSLLGTSTRHLSPIIFGIFYLTHLLHQVDQAQEIFEPKVAATSGDHHERIRPRPVRPIGGNRAQAPRRVMEIQPLPPPAVPVHHDLELLRAQRVERMRDPELPLQLTGVGRSLKRSPFRAKAGRGVRAVAVAG
jgi:hypothetical protein